MLWEGDFIKIFWEDVVYQAINTILFVYHTLKAYENKEDHEK